MIYYIEKRDGRKVPYNRRKIERAMEKAFIDVDGDVNENSFIIISSISDYVENKIKSGEDLTVENIQDLVVDGLMNTERKDVARSYVIYREDRSRIRQGKTDLIIKAGKKLMATNIENQNANIDEKSFGGRIGEATSVLTKEYALNYIVSEKVRYNHLHNRIYIHDLNSYAVGEHNCLSIPFDLVLKTGVKTRQVDIRGAKSVSSEFQLIAVYMQLQSLQQFGGVSATHIDHTSVPYIRMSFMKHYISEYLKSTGEFYELDILDMTLEEFDDWIDENKDKYLAELGLNKDDFYFDNKDNLDPKFYQAAIFETRKETYQAVEAMFHNLNSLQSRSGRIGCPAV